MQATAAARGVLHGTRVLDMSRVLAGPYCGMLLGDLGAEVIKVERPGSGDETRGWGPPFAGGESAYFMSINRNKQSICIDFHKEQGRQLIVDLAKKSDVLLENYLPGKLDEIGLGYDQLKTVNPRLIYCSVTGFGTTGPLARKPGYDILISAMYGLMSITGEPDRPPVKPGVALTDVLTGLSAHGAIMAALYERERSGVGQKVEASLMESQLAALVNIASNYLIGGVTATKRYGTSHASIVPYQAFDCSDGQMIVCTGNDRQFQSLCRVLQADNIANDPRFATNKLRVQNRDELIPQLQAILRTKTRAEWEEAFQDVDFPHGPVRSVAEAFEDEQVSHREMIQTCEHPTAGQIRLVGPAVKLSRTPAQIQSPPPLIGQHTDAVLKRLLQLSDEQIHALRSEQVIA